MQDSEATAESAEGSAQPVETEPTKTARVASTLPHRKPTARMTAPAEAAKATESEEASASAASVTATVGLAQGVGVTSTQDSADKAEVTPAFAAQHNWLFQFLTGLEVAEARVKKIVMAVALDNDWDIDKPESFLDIVDSFCTMEEADKVL